MLKTGNLCHDNREQLNCTTCTGNVKTGSTLAALNDGLFLTTVSKSGAGDFVYLSLFISSNSLDGY